MVAEYNPREKDTGRVWAGLAWRGALVLGLLIKAQSVLAASGAQEPQEGFGGVEVLGAALLLVVLLLLRWTDRRPQIPWERFRRPPEPGRGSEEFSLNSYRASLGREPIQGEVFRPRVETPARLASVELDPVEEPGGEPEAERILVV